MLAQKRTEVAQVEEAARHAAAASLPASSTKHQRSLLDETMRLKREGEKARRQLEQLEEERVAVCARMAALRQSQRSTSCNYYSVAEQFESNYLSRVRW